MFYDKKLITLNLSSNSSELPLVNLLKSFLDSNPKTGYVMFQVSQESVLHGILPISNAKITISKLLGDDYFISKVVWTNEDGKTNPIPLPTVQSRLSTVPGNGIVNSNYIARVESPNFITKDVFDIQIFENITSIEAINLLPNNEELQRTYESLPQISNKLW